MPNKNKKINTSELLEEFVNLYKNSNQGVPANTDALVILTGDRPPAQEENISRIKYAVTLLKKLRKDTPVIFSGITEEKENAVNLMINLGVPKENCYFQDCGKFGIANTKTQFETMVSDPLTKDFKNLVIVTSTYHIPRVKRTAGKFLPLKTRFVVIGNPKDWKIHNPFPMIMNEIKKIIKYSTEGEISERPR
jgi:uncharacterized SAM-binding protein YcdF (DUF218 family)